MDVRWKQRFQNFKKAFALLEKLSGIAKPSEGERMGIIQAFEMCFELAWKMIGDDLKEQGFLEKSPRDVLKRAHQLGILAQGHVWMDALKDRNETVHLYDEKKVMEIEKKIKTAYLPALQVLHAYYQAKK